MVSELKSGLQLISFFETWAHNDITDSEIEIFGYQIFRHDRPKGIRGGVAVYARNDVKDIYRHESNSKIQRSTDSGLKFSPLNRTV